MISNIYKIRILLAGIIIALSGCNAREFDYSPEVVDEPLLTVSFTDKDAHTRSLSDQPLTKESLSFFLFEKTDDSTAKFIFSPDVSKTSISKDNNLSNTYNVSFKIPDKEYEGIHMVVLHNYKGLKPTVGQKLSDFSKTHLVDGFKTILSRKSIPFYGLTSFTVDRKQINASVILRNPLAKINFKVDDNLFDDSIHKYMISSLASVRVYRTLDKSSIAVDPLNVDNQGLVFAPTIPSDAQYYLNDGNSSLDIADADKQPLLFDFSSAPLKEYRDQINIPEVFNKPNDLRKNVASIVVGVYLSDPKYSGQQRYYRLDFAEYETNNLTPKKFLSVLRNHIYNFTLGGVQTEGTDDPTEALEAPSSIWLDLQVWNDEDLSSIINGEYYLSMESSDIKLDYIQGSSSSIPFKTNIEGDLESSIRLSWGDAQEATSDYFTARVVSRNGGHFIEIQSKNENASAVALEDILHVYVMNHSFKFKVIQKDKRPDFYISQTDYSVNGVYVRNQNLVDGVHTIRVRLYARNKSERLNGLKYEITANPMEGLYIDDLSGYFDNVKLEVESGLQYQDVLINIKGMSPYAKNKRLTILATGKEESYLNAIIPYAYIPKKVLGLFGSSSTNKLSQNQGFSRLIGSPENFGLDVNSLVKAEPISYVESSDANLQGLIQRENPDVIIWGDGYALSQSQAQILRNYMTARNDLGGPGVVLGLNGTQSSVVALFSALGMTSGSPSSVSLSHTYNSISGGNAGLTQNRYRLPVYDWDLGVNGSFGALGTRYIQLSSSDLSLTNLNFEYVLKYTGNLAFGQSKDRFDYAVSSCRLVGYPLFWVGSNKFLDSAQWLFSGNKLNNYPETKYTESKEIYDMKLTTNSVFFANMLEWSFHTAEYGLNN